MPHPPPLRSSTAPVRPLHIVRRYLAMPDVVVPLEGPVSPVQLAVTTALGLAGTGLFLGTLGLGLASVATDGASEVRWWAAVGVPPLVGLLSLPPLYLATVLRERTPKLLELGAVAASGPTVAGAWLAAGTPLLALFLLTGEVDPAFFLLGFGMLVVAFAAGAGAAVRNAKRASACVPGPIAVLFHYAFTTWTAVVLALHLIA